MKLIDLLRDLVAFESLSPTDGGALDYLSRRLKKIGAECHRIDRGVTSNLVVTLGSGQKIFAFAGHVDVVPSGDVSRWQNGEPFKLYQDGDKLIGRGSADMKGAIAAFIIALEQFVDSGNYSADDYQIMLLLTSDEEGSAIDGTPIIVEYLQSKGIILDYCLVGEPSAVDVFGDSIKVGRRGSLTGELKVIGKQGHIAYPNLCKNPIHDFALALAELTALNWDNGNDYFPPSGFQFANLNAGVGATNVIPGELWANFNFRYNNLQTVEGLQRQVISVLDKYNLDYQLQWQHSASPFFTTPGRLVEVLSAVINQVCGITPQLKTDGGTSDGRFLVAVSREILECGLKNDSIHQINEYTTVGDLVKLSAVYQTVLSQIFTGSDDINRW